MWCLLHNGAGKEGRGMTEGRNKKEGKGKIRSRGREKRRLLSYEGKKVPAEVGSSKTGRN